MLTSSSCSPLGNDDGQDRRRNRLCGSNRWHQDCECSVNPSAVREQRERRRVVQVAMVVTFLFLPATTSSTLARQDEAPAVTASQATDQIPNALYLVPDDVAFFASSMNHRTQYEALVQSRAFAELANMPLTRAMIEAFRVGFAEGANQSLDEMRPQLEAALGKEQVANMIRFGTDVVSHEMFLYGSADFTNLFEVAQEMNLGFGPISLGEGDAEQEEMSKAFLLKVGAILDERGEELKVPDLVIGFRVEDAELARQHVELLHAFVSLGLIGGDVPAPIRRGYRKAKVGDVEFLKLQLSGSLLQLDALAEEADETLQPLLHKLADHLHDEQIAIAIGVMDNYLLISIGDSLEHLNRLGQAQALIHRDEFAGLRQQAERPLGGVTYCSEALAKAISGKPLSQQLVDLVRAMQAGDSEFQVTNAELFAQLELQAEELGRDIDGIQQKPAAMASYVFLTEDGYEGFQYSWSISPLVDGRQTLTILSHVDQNPMLFAAGRAAEPGRLYELFSKWTKRLDPIVMQLLDESSDDEDVQQFLQVREMVMPYWLKLDETTREALIPAIQDGQSALIVDFKNARQNWGPGVPEGSYPLVMPELAMVCAVSDRAKFIKAMSVYDEFARDMLNLLAVQAGEDFPDEIALPQATSMEIDGGATVYYYPAPQLEELGLDKAFRPNLLLTDKWGIFSLTVAHSERLLEPKPLPNAGPFRRQDQPLVAASGMNFPVLVDAIESWFRYADDLGAFENLELSQDGPFQLSKDELLQSIETLFVVLRCYQGFESVTFVEDGATVIQSRVRFVDIPW